MNDFDHSKHFRASARLALILPILLLAVCSSIETARAEQANVEDAVAIATDAYVYGYSLIRPTSRACR